MCLSVAVGSLIYSEPSLMRTNCILVKNRLFFYSLEEITKNCKALALLIRREPIEACVHDFESLLRFVSPKTSGIQAETISEDNLLPLLRISETLHLKELSSKCRQFLISQPLKRISAMQLVEMLNNLPKGQILTGSCLVKAILEHRERRILPWITRNSPSAGKILKEAKLRFSALQHDFCWINAATPFHCDCPTETESSDEDFRPASPSFCGLYCSNCRKAFCSKCRKSRLCMGSISRFLSEYQKEEEEETGKKIEVKGNKKITLVLREKSARPALKRRLPAFSSFSRSDL